MNVFDFRQHIVNEYAAFTRSFTRIKADDIQSYVVQAYDSQKYWPEPLIQVNPNFKPGGTVQQLVEAGQLHSLCAEIFRLGKKESSVGVSLSLHIYQQEAISKVALNQLRCRSLSAISRRGDDRAPLPAHPPAIRFPHEPGAPLAKDDRARLEPLGPQPRHAVGSVHRRV